MIHARLRKIFPARADSAAFSLDAEFEAPSGITALFGPSGSGKTLTLDLLAGFAIADEGRILLDDQILYDHASGVNLTPQQRRCGYVFQNYALFPHMTLRENIEFAAESHARLERRKLVNEMLEAFRLADVAGKRAHQVSGGQRQRCSIARALIGRPRMLLLDEPAQGLDAQLRAELHDILRNVHAEYQTPVLMVTHDLEECFALNGRMLILREGRLVQAGAPQEILDQPANLDVARLLGRHNTLPAEIRSLDPGRNLSRLVVGQFELEGPYFPAHFKGDRVTLCVRPEQLQVSARVGKLEPNQVELHLQRALPTPNGMRLDFAGPVAALVPYAQWELLREGQDWAVHFPREALRVVSPSIATENRQAAASGE
jgi:molybdate transport system ATP-binding protein